MAFAPVMGKPQKQLLIEYFRRYHTISALEAAGQFKIRSLSRRINDLEEAGHRFYREVRADATGQRYTRYHYLGHGLPDRYTAAR